MKNLTWLAVALILSVGLVSVKSAVEVTVTGNVMCAKCTLKKGDAKACQDVLVVKDESGATKEYYLTKNAVQEQFGHVCTGQKPAVVTGVVTEKDGKTWLTASKMTEAR